MENNPAPTPRFVRQLGRYASWFTPEELVRLEAILSEPIPAAVRLNPLKAEVSTLLEKLAARYQWKVEPISFCPECWQVLESKTPLSQTPEYRMGLYYIQDAASGLSAELFHFQPDEPEIILDMTAAPGGKTTHLVSKVRDRGVILANDSSADRLAGLRYNMQAWGATNTMITHFDGGMLGHWFPETFHKVLLDAPCSAETLLPDKGRPSGRISQFEREMLHRRQTELLTSALRAAKVGGEVVYSTCTLAPEENEAVLDALLRLYPHQIEIVPVDLPASHFASGLPAFGEVHYHPQVRNAIRVYPLHLRTSGFVAALIRKKDHLPYKPSSYRRLSLAKRGVTEVGEPLFSQVVDSVQQTYGFDMRSWLEADGLAVWQQGAALYAASKLMTELFSDVPYFTMGLMIGQMQDKHFVPSQELISRFQAAFTQNWLTLPNTFTKLWLEGRELRNTGLEEVYPQGTIVLLRDEEGAFLGRGRVVPKRIRNLLPR